MRRWRVLAVMAGCLAGCLLAAGCATKTDLARMENRIKKLETRNQALEKRISEQIEQLDQMLEKREQQDNKLRELFAGQDAEFYQLRNEVRQLSGRFEEGEYRDSRKFKDLSTTLEASREKLASLTERVELNDARISRMAAYLGIESDEKLNAAVKARKDEAGDANKGGAPEELPADKLYAFAKKSFDRKNYETARDAFEKFLETYPDSDKADNARFWIAEIYFNEQWYEKAILEYQSVMDNYPKGNKVPAAYLKQGIAFQELDETGNAKLVLKELIRKFPDTNEADIARKKINQIE